MSHIRDILISFLLCISLTSHTTVVASTSYPYVVLSLYNATVDIGDEFYMVALTSTGKKPTWRSSDSKIVSVSTYGKVTAKKAGIATITAKIKDAEASCKVKVKKTSILLSKKTISLEHGESFTLNATTSNDSKVKWKTSKKSIATVDENGTITGQKPGEAIISALADGSSASCKVRVKKPTVRLSQASASLYRKERVHLTATVSSSIKPIWKTNKKSVATVTENGWVTAIKHGSATISATVDGVTSKCYITVKQPKITLSQTDLTLQVGEHTKITAEVSSGNSPEWTTSNNSIATVSNGTICAIAKGTAYIYAKEDGVKERCKVVVKEAA